MIGKTVLHYKILEELGRGGMGVVYKAEDTKLKRTVALKFLPQQTMASDEEKARFQYEAQAAAALDHPNVCTIHEINEADGQTFIAMAYVEGQSLQEETEANLSKVLNLRKALDYAIQIAEGLQAAHEKEIVHRDIKPANILITEKEQVRITDFGLAKLAGRTQLTKEGTSMGTVAYMSPEQTHGVDVDHRTDIWALGAVIFEMITGKQPFVGDYEQAVIYSILNEEPEFPDEIPDNLQKILQKALAKDLAQRYQDIGELLADLKTLTGLKTPPATGRLPLLVGGPIVLLLLLGFGYFFFKKGPTDLKIVSTRPLTSTPGFEGQPTWSPDGTRIAYTSNEGGRHDIWVRQISAGQSINLTKDQPGNNTRPAWSPDGQWIAFFSDREDGGLFAMPALGGNSRRIIGIDQADYAFSPPVWSPDGSKLAFIEDGIHTISAEGGEASLVPFDQTGLFLQNPAWSPDGQRITITEVTGVGNATGRLWNINLASEESHPLTSGRSLDYNSIWTYDGKRILFVSDRSGTSDIWYIPVAENGESAGPAKALTTGIGVGAIALSADGTKLAYEKTVKGSSIWSVPITQDGPLTFKDARFITSENAIIEKIDMSPDGKWLAIDSNRSGNSDIWIMRPDGSDLRQITTDPAHDWFPTWSPDSKQIAFHSLRSGNRDIWVKPIIGGVARQLTTDPGKDWASVWSPNSGEIAFIATRGGQSDIWIVSESEGPRRLTFHTATVLLGAWSPDGQKLAFASSHSKGGELYLVSVNSEKNERLIPTQSRRIFAFAWSSDGSTIYAIIGDESDITRSIYAISVETGAEKKLTNFEIDATKTLFWATSDGERFYLVFHEKNSDIWVAELAEEK